MKRFSKLWGAGTGTAIALLIGVFLPEGSGPQVETLAKVLEMALPLIGTFVAPANTP